MTVFEIGRRFISARIGLIAAVIATVHPYLVWHDIHGNREILDQLLGAAMFGLTLLLASRPSLRYGALLGLVSGVAILSNTRLVLLPFVLGIFLLRHRSGWLIAAMIPVLAGVAMAPWVIRNKVDVGCWAITTDARSLWKANNANTYSTLAHGLWIDQVPDIPQRRNGPAPTEMDHPARGRQRLHDPQQDRLGRRVRAGGRLRAHGGQVLGAPPWREGEARGAGDGDVVAFRCRGARRSVSAVHVQGLHARSA